MAEQQFDEETSILEFAETELGDKDSDCEGEVTEGTSAQEKQNQSGHGGPRNSFWSTEYCDLLVKSVGEHFKKLSTKGWNKKQVWEDIHQLVKEKLPNVTLFQCVTKWNNLRRAYFNYEEYRQLGGDVHRRKPKAYKFLHTLFASDSFDPPPPDSETYELHNAIHNSDGDESEGLNDDNDTSNYDPDESPPAKKKKIKGDGKHGGNRKGLWNDEKTVILIKAILQNYRKLRVTGQHKSRRAPVWSYIYSIVHKKIPDLSLTQMRFRWKNLKYMYLDYCAKTRAGFVVKKPPHFELMFDILGDGEETIPPPGEGIAAPAGSTMDIIQSALHTALANIQALHPSVKTSPQYTIKIENSGANANDDSKRKDSDDQPIRVELAPGLDGGASNSHNPDDRRTPKRKRYDSYAYKTEALHKEMLAAVQNSGKRMEVLMAKVTEQQDTMIANQWALLDIERRRNELLAEKLNFEKQRYGTSFYH